MTTLTTKTTLNPLHLPDFGNTPGHLRADGPALIEAHSDLEAVSVWLQERSTGSEQTKRSYFLHAERFLLWAAHEKQKSLSDVTANDLSEYRDFLLSPTPAERWCGPITRRDDPQWRPFKGGLSPSSQQLSMTILGSMFSFLCDAGYLRGNPTRLLRRAKNGNDKKPVERFLPEHLINAVKETLDERWLKNSKKIKEWEQARWVFILFVSLGLRRDEVAAHTHGAFFQRNRPSGLQWWIRIVGKGGKERVVPVPTSTLDSLRRYRSHLGLPELPGPNDETPLVVGLRKAGSISTTQLYRIITTLLRETAKRIEARDPYGAELLEKASPHWLRHSYITTLGDMGVSLRHRRLSAGHSSMDTTLLYDHADEDEWYADIQKLNEKSR